MPVQFPPAQCRRLPLRHPSFQSPAQFLLQAPSQVPLVPVVPGTISLGPALWVLIHASVRLITKNAVARMPVILLSPSALARPDIRPPRPPLPPPPRPPMPPSFFCRRIAPTRAMAIRT